MSRADAQWLICIIFVVCALGFYGYKYWNAPPPTVHHGKAWVIDGDTVVISGTHIRLEGIDAPEKDQTCMDANGKPWACGQTATRELRGLIGGRDLTCDKRAEDRYQRALAVCKLPDGSDVNPGWCDRVGLWPPASSRCMSSSRTRPKLRSAASGREPSRRLGNGGKSTRDRTLRDSRHMAAPTKSAA
jgi:hypothetical protein